MNSDVCHAFISFALLYQTLFDLELELYLC